MPTPPSVNLPTSPAVLEITPAPTLDIEATATVLALKLRPSPTPLGLYLVQEGDTLDDLADRFQINAQVLLDANKLTDPEALKPGQSLIIPTPSPKPITNTLTVGISPTTKITQTKILTATSALTLTSALTATLPLSPTLSPTLPENSTTPSPKKNEETEEKQP